MIRFTFAFHAFFSLFNKDEVNPKSAFLTLFSWECTTRNLHADGLFVQREDI